MTRLDPVALQVMLGALRAACDEMGAVLVRSAHSANIKERRDASTALFDARGRMVMQAEHIPVHLGAMPSAVAAMLDEQHEPGVAWILNDPYRGGTHLPDITVISPLFHRSDLVGFAASRAHHADVGARLCQVARYLDHLVRGDASRDPKQYPALHYSRQHGGRPAT
jgi:N-methylhydantoinase B